MRLLIDVDEVTCHFVPEYKRIATSLLGRDLSGYNADDSWHIEEALGLSAEEGDAVWEVCCRPGFAAHLEPVAGAVEAINKLSIEHEIVFVTAPLKLSPTWGYDRRAWLRQYFPNVNFKLVLTKDKYLVDGDVMIDDHPQLITQWVEERRRRSARPPRAVLYARTHNAHSIPPHLSEYCKRLSDWELIVEYIWALNQVER